MSGMILVGMATLRLGRLILYIPESVTFRFYRGIGVVIATLQLKDFWAQRIAHMPEQYLAKLMALAQALPSVHFTSLLVASATLATMLLWPKLKTPVPAHLPAIILGTILALVLNAMGMT